MEIIDERIDNGRAFDFGKISKESWNGRMKTCRAIGASLPQRKISEWEREHLRLLDSIAPENFDILHYGAIF